MSPLPPRRTPAHPLHRRQPPEKAEPKQEPKQSRKAAKEKAAEKKDKEQS